jgi:hypothetical protein
MTPRLGSGVCREREEAAWCSRAVNSRCGAEDGELLAPWRRPAGEASSRLMLPWLKTVVVSDEEKARITGQAGIGKASESELLMTCRDQETGIRTGASQ